MTIYRGHTITLTKNQRSYTALVYGKFNQLVDTALGSSKSDAIRAAKALIDNQ